MGTLIPLIVLIVVFVLIAVRKVGNINFRIWQVMLLGAAVVDQTMEVEDCDALFVTFRLQKEDSHLIIARSRSGDIDLNALLLPFGGGGHPQAASALVKHSADFPIHRHLIQHLKLHLSSGLTAAAVMKWIEPIRETATLMETSIHLERQNESGTVVVGADGLVKGVVTLRDIQRGRMRDQMQAPVKTFMSRNPITADPGLPIRGLERLFYLNDIGHLPILENEALLGMVTRSSYLAFIRNKPRNGE